MEFEIHRSPNRPPPRKYRDIPVSPDKIYINDFEDFFEWNDTKIQTDEISDFELNFTPLSSGLGFHQESKSSSSLPSLPKKNQGLWEKPKYFSFEEAKKKKFQETELQSFYEPEHEEVFGRIFSSETESEKLKIKFEVAIARQFLAWSLDTLLVSALVLGNLALMFSASGLDIAAQSLTFETGLLGAGLWVFWYMTYFTFLEYTSFTPGKKLLGIVLKSESRRSLDFSQAFLRSFFSLFSILTLGIFTLMSGPSIASKTKVYKNE